jgi:hypothetical protein
MSLLLYLAVLVVSLSGVIFGLDWAAAPAPEYRPATQVVVRSHGPPPVRHLGSDAATRPIVPPAPPNVTVAAKPVAPGAPLPPPPVAAVSPPPAPAVEPDPSPTAIAVAEPLPKCDVNACQAAYISFRAADCTYQPSFGPRRLCEKGTPPQPAAAPTTQASACNVEACQQAYFTFNPVDCTYQPSHGARRLCEK